MTNAQHRIVRHNFDAVNSHIEGLNRYVRNAAAEKRANTFAVCNYSGKLSTARPARAI